MFEDQEQRENTEIKENFFNINLHLKDCF